MRSSTLHAAVVAVLMFTASLGAAELVAGNDFSKPKETILTSWKVKAEEAAGISQMTEGGLSFIRLTCKAPGSVLMRQDIAIPADAKTLTLEFNLRVSDVARGEKRWNVPRIAILWRGDTEKTQQVQFNFTKAADWDTQRSVIPIPGDYKAFSLWVGTPSGTGVMDISTLSIQAE